MGSESVASLWVGLTAMGGQKVSCPLSVSCSCYTAAPNLYIFFGCEQQYHSTEYLREEKTFSDISMLTNRCKEKQVAFFLFSNCNSIVLVYKVTGILTCVILGKHARKKKGLIQNPRATLAWNFSSSAGQQPSQEIKATVQKAAECTVTITWCRQSETSKAGYINIFIKVNY